jgi:chorismate synthase
MKRTSSIPTPRQTATADGRQIDPITRFATTPAWGIRAVPVGEAMMACALPDHLLLDRGKAAGVRGRIG